MIFFFKFTPKLLFAQADTKNDCKRLAGTDQKKQNATSFVEFDSVL